jgi:hypothetical protein
MLLSVKSPKSVVKIPCKIECVPRIAAQTRRIALSVAQTFLSAVSRTFSLLGGRTDWVLGVVARPAEWNSAIQRSGTLPYFRRGSPSPRPLRLCGLFPSGASVCLRHTPSCPAARHRLNPAFLPTNDWPTSRLLGTMPIDGWKDEMRTGNAGRILLWGQLMKYPELQSLLGGLVGEPVTGKTIAGNTIILWFKPNRTKGFWIDPPWRLEVAGRIEATCAEFPWEREESETEEQYRTRFETACSHSDCLKTATLASVTIDPKTSDLVLAFDEGRVLRTFILTPDQENWHFSDYETKRQYLALGSCVTIKPLDVEPAAPPNGGPATPVGNSEGPPSVT